MKSYFQSYPDYIAAGGSHKSTTIKPHQLLPAIVANMTKLNKQFTLNVNGRLPKNIDGMLVDAFEESHMQQPFYTQHCEYRSYRYGSISKNRIRIEFTVQYRMNRAHEKWMIDEMHAILAQSIRADMTTLEKIVAVHDYIARTFTYDLNTAGSPYAVYTFMKEKHGVCMAYALLFEKMMELLEIPCYYVIGKADGEGDAGHAWNMVEIDGHWYHIDVTWDDLSSKSKIHQIRYRYFLVSDEVMKRDHIWNLKDYPPCTSERFSSLHALYDVCIVGNRLYYPHQKTAYLYTLDMTKQHLQAERLLETRVQMVNHLEGKLYFSNYSAKGWLFSYDLATAEIMALTEVQAISILSSEAGLDVRLVDQPTLTIEKTVIEEIEEIEELQQDDAFTTIPSVDDYHQVPFIHFDQTWMASYEQGNLQKPLAFTSDNGVEFRIGDFTKQLTIDVFIDKGLNIHLTSQRKEVILDQPALFIIPTSLLPKMPTELSTRLPSGELLPVEHVMKDQKLFILLSKSTSIIL